MKKFEETLFIFLEIICFLLTATNYCSFLTTCHYYFRLKFRFVFCFFFKRLFIWSLNSALTFSLDFWGNVLASNPNWWMPYLKGNKENLVGCFHIEKNHIESDAHFRYWQMTMSFKWTPNFYSTCMNDIETSIFYMD